MTWEEIFKKVIVALDEAESTVLSSNMEDYRLKMYECADSCQREMAVFVCPIVKKKEIEVTDGETETGTDCYEALAVTDEEGQRVSFKNNGDGTLAIDTDGVYTLKYNGYPARFSDSGDLSGQPEIKPEAQEAMVYGICAGLCINDEPDLYAIYMGRYNGLIDMIIQRRNQQPQITITGGIRL